MSRDTEKLPPRAKDQGPPMFHAVVVGVNEYQDRRIRPLEYATKDASALAHLFESRIRREETSVTLITDESATRERVMEAIGEELSRKVGRDDSVFLYFACHGSPERDHPRGEDRPYLVLNDTSYDRIYSTGIDMSITLSGWFERLDAKLVVACLDTCFSGGAGRSFLGPTHLAHREAFHSDDPISLRDLELGAGQVIMAAAGDHEPALETAAREHGVFTYHLLSALRQTRSGDGTIGLGTLADVVGRAVRKETGGIQTPLFNGRAAMAALPLFGTER